MAAEIGHQPGQRVVGAPFDQRGDGALVADVVEQTLAPGAAALEGQGRIQLVGTGVDPLAELQAAGFAEGLLQQGAVFEDPDLPAHRLEQFGDPLVKPFAHHGIETLAIVIDDPPAILQAVLPAFQQAFENVALVQFGIADHCYHAAGRALRAQALGSQIVLDQAGEHGDGGAEPDRAGGKIHIVDVLGARRIGLSAAQAAIVFQLLPRLLPEQILDGVKDRTGVGLHRDTVFRPQDVKIERRQDGGRRGR